MTGLVRLVDDDQDLLAAQVQGLRIAGFTVEPFNRAEDSLRGMTADYPGVVLTDVRMPGMDGLDLFARLQAIDPDLPVMLLTGHGDVPMAVQALKNGVYDFLTKPVALTTLEATLRRAVAARRLVLENRMLRQMQAAGDTAGGLLIGDSGVMTHLRETALRVAEAGVDVLITGDSGVGKEALARALHRAGPRRARPLVQVNCATINEERFESEFLGIEAGLRGELSRVARRPGRLERAHRGTLFLDGIEALSPALQARFLTLIEAREIWLPGAEAARPLDMQVIATSRADLAQLVRTGAFRADLFYRLSGVLLHVPPLADRRSDVPLLFQHFLLAAAARLKRPVPPLTPELTAHLAAHDWPGNVRELLHYAERYALGLDAGPAPGLEAAAGLSDQVARYEAHLIRDALRLSRGNATAAMARLKLPRKTFYDKLTRHGIRSEDFRH
ncbi:two-component system, NtrC family, C4-dicarboxylate transport response regulator DctD [Gemmobacter aquatilis]|uniref:Two-component system, NtrC family, C4-dicarboxylate transport response regulator DctD n=1 Tax=Gemmobacter aquatilis TaxID=933059 RepID=A0A1H7Z3W2_9RHOB|nr:sigma-54 dependent transcriptional regulator [Gemmobacter aquatilis]SEM53150.1 two-component system, NtrC family, C4-dicarboxylate transport response regulator DctD [Gemmobacter aquatilis]